MNQAPDPIASAPKTERRGPPRRTLGTPHRSKPLKWLVLLLVLAAGTWAGFRHWSRPAYVQMEYKTSPVERGDVVQSVTANGSLTAVQLVEVGSQISGVITDIKVDFNSTVKAGDVVAQIDPATYERALGEAEAELASAEAAQELAQLNFDRGEELFTSRLISKSEFDQLRVNLSQAKAQVKTRQASVDRAKVNLSRTTILAPINGVVITRQVEEGQTVAATMNAPTLFTIANDLRNMRIEAAVSEADIGGVEDGQRVHFTVDAFPGRTFAGDVQQVRYAPSTNQNVVTYTAIVQVDNNDLKLRPGMTATARFITAERKNVLKVPLAALRIRPPAGVTVIGDTNAPPQSAAAGAAAWGSSNPQPQTQSNEPQTATLYLKEQAADRASDGQVVLRAVIAELGIADASNVEILEGLKENDEVVTGIISAPAVGQSRNPLGNPFGGARRP